MLANLELREMEPERLHLPSEVLDGPARHATEPRSRERVPDLVDLVEQFGWLCVPATGRPRIPGQVVARPTEPLGDGPEASAIRFIGKAPPERGVEIGETFRVVDEAPGHRPVQSIRGDVHGDGLHQPSRDRLVAAHHVIGLDSGGVLREVGGHAGVAVPIAADPGPEPEDRREFDRVLRGLRAACRPVRSALTRAGVIAARSARWTAGTRE